MINKQIFKELGLTNAEIEVYLTLLKLGSSQAGSIIEKSNLQTSVVHRALLTLIDKGLINYIIEGKRKTYQATEPEHFLEFIDDKKRQFKEILPELKQQQNTAQKEQATIYKGIRGIKESYNIMINTNGEEYLTYGGGEECAKRMGMTWWLNMHQRRITNKLPSRQVFDETVRLIGGSDIEKLPKTNIKYVPEDFAQFQEIVIVGNKVAVNVFTESPYAFIVEDEKVAEGYKKYFEVLWNKAK